MDIEHRQKGNDPHTWGPGVWKWLHKLPENAPSLSKIRGCLDHLCLPCPSWCFLFFFISLVSSTIFFLLYHQHFFSSCIINNFFLLYHQHLTLYTIKIIQIARSTMIPTNQHTPLRVSRHGLRLFSGYRGCTWVALCTQPPAWIFNLTKKIRTTLTKG